MNGHEVVAVIPARYGSTRLPGKPLAAIDGIPMVVRVWRQAIGARQFARVLVATDDQRIAAAARQAGAEVAMTSARHPSGTDRVAEVARSIESEVFVNVQGDLPFIASEDLDALAAAMRAERGLEMATLATPIASPEEWRNPNVVKVVCDLSGNALYFSRSPIPCPRDGAFPADALRHIGVYAFRRDFLLRFAELKPGRLEQVEKLEQLRALENGCRIRVIAAGTASLEVDTQEDLARAVTFARGYGAAQTGENQ